MTGPAGTAERHGGRARPGVSVAAPAGHRRWLRLPSRRTLVLLAVLTLATTGFAGWALYASDWLRITRVSVSWSGGQQELTADQVERVAAVPVGAPMATLDKDGIRARLLAELPRLKSVSVVRAWPDGVGLKVTERAPEALMPTDSGYTHVDDEGVAFAETDARPAGVPLLRLDLTEDASLRRFGEDRIRAEAVSVVGALPAAVRERAGTLRVRGYDAITVELSDGRTVRWGSAEQPEAKARALAALWKAAGDAEHFDVTVPSAPAVSRG